MTIKKHWPLLIKLTISVLLIVLLMSQVDTLALVQNIAELAPEMALISFVIILLQVIPAVQRWIAVLHAIGGNLSFWHGCRLFFIGVFFNQTLPSAIGGDAVRIFFVYRAGMSLRNAVNSVLLERIVTVAALIFLVLAFYPLFADELSSTTRSWFQPILLFLAAFLFISVVGFPALTFLIGKKRQWRIIRAFLNLAEDMRKLLLSPRLLLQSFAWALVGNATVSLAVYVLALGLNIDVTLVACQVLVPLANLMTMIPVSIAGWGIREGTMILLFGLVGIASEEILLLSILFGLTAVASGLPGAVMWMIESDMRKHFKSEFTPS